MEQLRQTLLKDIKLQEEIREQYRKILFRQTIIYVVTSLILLLLSVCTLFIITRPISQNEVALKNIQDLNSSMIMQRRFIEMDRQDVAKAREQFIYLMHFQDSIKKQQDSVWEFNYKKATKK